MESPLVRGTSAKWRPRKRRPGLRRPRDRHRRYSLVQLRPPPLSISVFEFVPSLSGVSPAPLQRHSRFFFWGGCHPSNAGPSASRPQPGAEACRSQTPRNSPDSGRGPRVSREARILSMGTGASLGPGVNRQALSVCAPAQALGLHRALSSHLLPRQEVPIWKSGVASLTKRRAVAMRCARKGSRAGGLLGWRLTLGGMRAPKVLAEVARGVSLQ